MLKFTEHIVKVGDEYRLLSHKGKNLGTFDSHAAAAKHEGEVEYFKAHESADIDTELSEHKGCQYCGGPIAGYTCTKCGKVQQVHEEAEDADVEMCIYCSVEPQDPKYAPYCSNQCAINAENDNAMDEAFEPHVVKAEGVLDSVRRVLRESDEAPANPKEEAKFTKVCEKYGFKLVKTERRVPNRFAPTHLLDELTFDKVVSNRTKPHRVKVTMYVDGDKSWKYWYIQSNGIEAPCIGDNSNQLDKALAKENFNEAVNEDWVPPAAEQLERMVLKAMPRKNSISADQMAEKLSMRMAWMGPDGMERLRLEVSYALANLASRNMVRRIPQDRMGKNRFVRANMMGESTTDVTAGDLGFKPIKGKNQKFAYPEKLSYGGRSWTKQTSGGEHWEAKDKLAAIKYTDRYGNILKVANSLSEDFSVTRCECPDDSVDHEAHDCQNDATYKVERDGQSYYLCGDCILSGDREREKLDNDLDEAVTRYAHECTSCNKSYAPNLNECPECGSNRTKDTMETVEFYPKTVKEDAIEDMPSMNVADSEKDKQDALDKAAPDPKDKAMPDKKLTEGYYMIHYTDGTSEKFEGSASQARAKAAKSSKSIDDIETLSQTEFTSESVHVKRFGQFITEDNEPNRLCSVCKDPAEWHHVGRDLDYCDKCKPQHAMQKLTNSKLILNK